MVFTLFASIQGWIQSFCRGAKQDLRQWTRPDNSADSLAVGTARNLTRSKWELVLENALLRQQLIVLQRQVKRPPLTWRDRALFVLIVSKLPSWKTALMIVQPEALLRWHRDLFRWVWRRKSQREWKGGRQPLAEDVVRLIKDMARENRTWGAERIRGELLKLGTEVTKSTIQRYINEVRGPLSTKQTWSTFLRNHAQDIWACDFLQTYDLFFRTIFVFVVIEGVDPESCTMLTCVYCDPPDLIYRLDKSAVVGLWAVWSTRRRLRVVHTVHSHRSPSSPRAIQHPIDIHPRRHVVKSRVPPFPVVVTHPRINDPVQSGEGRRIQEQRIPLRLEPAVERFHLRIVLGAPQGIRQSNSILAQQLRRPGVAGEDRILVLVQNHAGTADPEPLQSVPRPLPGFQGQGRVRCLTYGPAEHHLAGISNDWDQIAFLPAVGKSNSVKSVYMT
jgi:hypothetical protein